MKDTTLKNFTDLDELRAVAEDLLLACQYAMVYMCEKNENDYKEVFEQLEKSINKAEGKT